MLHAVVTDINTVDETFRPAYVEKDGKFFLNVTPVEGFALEDVKGLKNALGAERTLKDQALAAMKPFEGLDPATARQAIEAITAYGDITPQKAKDLAEGYERLSKIDPKAQADKLAEEKAEAIRKALAGEYGSKETALQDQIKASGALAEGLKTQLRTLLVSNQVKAELARHNPLDGAADVLELLAERSISTAEVDGKFVVQVKDEAGNPRVKVEGSTVVPFTVADLIAEIKETKPAFFKPEDKGGIGIQPGRTIPRSTQKNPWAKDTLNRTEQVLLKKSNPTLAAQMMREAGVA